MWLIHTSFMQQPQWIQTLQHLGLCGSSTPHSCSSRSGYRHCNTWAYVAHPHLIHAAAAVDTDIATLGLMWLIHTSFMQQLQWIQTLQHLGLCGSSTPHSCSSCSGYRHCNTWAYVAHPHLTHAAAAVDTDIATLGLMWLIHTSFMQQLQWIQTLQHLGLCGSSTPHSCSSRSGYRHCNTWAYVAHPHLIHAAAAVDTDIGNTWAYVAHPHLTREQPGWIQTLQHLGLCGSSTPHSCSSRSGYRHCNTWAYVAHSHLIHAAAAVDTDIATLGLMWLIHTSFMQQLQWIQTLQRLGLCGSSTPHSCSSRSGYRHCNTWAYVAHPHLTHAAAAVDTDIGNAWAYVAHPHLTHAAAAVDTDIATLGLMWLIHTSLMQQPQWIQILQHLGLCGSSTPHSCSSRSGYRHRQHYSSPVVMVLWIAQILLTLWDKEKRNVQ